MAFTRETLASYEKPAFVPEVTPPPAASAPEPATPAAAVTAPDTSTASSAQDAPAVPAEPVDDGLSGDTAAAPTAPADPDNAPPDADAGDGKPVPRGRAQERIEELVAERNALREYGKYMSARVEELARARGAPAPTEAAPAATIADNDKPPTLEESKFDPVAHAQKTQEWLERQVEKRVNAAVERRIRQQDDKATVERFDARAAELAKVHANYQTVISNPALPKLAPETAGKIVRSELGPNIVYHLGLNIDLATRIARMEATDQLVAIGKLTSQLEAQAAAAAAPPAPKPTPPPKTVTRAPPPPTPVRGNESPQKGMNELSMDEWVAQDRAQQLAKRQSNLERRRAMR